MNHCDTTKKRTWAILTRSPLTSILISKILSGLNLSAPYSISFFYPAINSDSTDFCVHCSEEREKSYRGSHSLSLVFKGPGYHPRWITVRFLSLQSLQEAFFFKSNICAAAFFPIIIFISINTCIYWVGQKVHSGFSVTSHGKTQMNFLANPMLLYGEEKGYVNGEAEENRLEVQIQNWPIVWIHSCPNLFHRLHP